MSRPGDLWTSWTGVDVVESLDDGKQGPVTSHREVDTEQRRETGNGLDTVQPSHNYNQHSARIFTTTLMSYISLS